MHRVGGVLECVLFWRLRRGLGFEEIHDEECCCQGEQSPGAELSARGNVGGIVGRKCRGVFDHVGSSDVAVGGRDEVSEAQPREDFIFQWRRRAPRYWRLELRFSDKIGRGRRGGWALGIEIPFADERDLDIMENQDDDVATNEAGPGAAIEYDAAIQNYMICGKDQNGQ